MAIVAEGTRGRVYLRPTPEQEARRGKRDRSGSRMLRCPTTRAGSRRRSNGLTAFGDLFTDRQLVALTTFSDLVGEAIARLRA